MQVLLATRCYGNRVLTAGTILTAKLEIERTS